MEIEDIENNPFFLLPVWKQQTMLIFKSIVEHATHFEAILAEANKKKAD
jgi:hypothetical protein